MEVSWCPSCYTVYKIEKQCFFCKESSIFLDAEAMERKGRWYACCSRRYRVSPPAQTIGRDDMNTGFLFPESDSCVSSEHALLKVSFPYIFLQDVDGSNGTLIFEENSIERRLNQGEEVRLSSGAEIKLGKDICKVFLKWIPNALPDDAIQNLKKACNEILLPLVGESYLNEGVKIFTKSKIHFLEDSTELANAAVTAINRKLFSVLPLTEGDRIVLKGQEYEYTVRKLIPAAPLNPPRVVIRNLSLKDRLHIKKLDIEEGRFTCIIGVSGSGKSTLLKILTGWLSLPSGMAEMRMQGEAISFQKLAEHTAYVPSYDIVHSDLCVQNSLFYSVRLYEGEMNTAKIIEKVRRILNQVGLSEVKDKRIRDLSSGQRKRINIATQMIREKASFLILDEPTSGLDVGNDRKIMKLLQKLCRHGRTVVCATHHLSNIELFDRVVVLQKGEIHYQGIPAEVAMIARSPLEEANWEKLYCEEEKEDVAYDQIEIGISYFLFPTYSACILFQRRCEEFFHPKGIWQNLLPSVLLIPLLIGIMVIFAKPFAGIAEETRFFLCSVASFWLGMSLGSQEFRKDRYRIFLHEKDLGVKPVDFFFAYFLFCLFISLFQTFFLFIPNIGYIEKDSTIWTFFVFTWAMGVSGSLIGLTLSLIEERFKMPCSVSVPCLTIMQLLFSELVMGQLVQSGHSYFSFHFSEFRNWIYSITISRYLDMAYRSYRNTLEGIPEGFYENITVFLCLFSVILIILALLIKTARKED